MHEVDLSGPLAPKLAKSLRDSIVVLQNQLMDTMRAESLAV